MGNTPRQLFGSMGFTPRVGDLEAQAWAALRAGERPYGLIKNFQDTDGRLKDLMWFADPVARHDFLQIFGGMSVTMTREGLNTFNDAKIAQKLGA